VSKFWARLTKRRRAAEEELAIEERNMSAEEREFFDESFEDRQADEESIAHLGGVDPKRLLDE
jgi:hypothetical protein